MMDGYQMELPVSWEKKIKSKKLKKLTANDALWLGRPSPTSREGRKILELNEPLFQYCETLDDFDYAFEPTMGNLIELLPADVHRQGAGISVDILRSALEVDIYFFPCDYSEDKKRKLPLMYVRVPIVTVGDTRLIDAFVRRYFNSGAPGKSAVIPFSLRCVAELQGYFIDEYEATERICRNAVMGGTEQEKRNCDQFLDFIRTAGLDTL